MDQWNTRKWSKWANALFKKEKPLGSEPWFNPEAVTEQKREWIEQQQKTQGVEDVTWPEHIYENFFIVGLPPDMELTQVAEQLCELERKKQRGDSDNDTEPGKEHLQPPQPSFTPQVLFRAPPGAPAPVSDDELAAFCFPSGVAPEKLKRTPSLSALDELVMGRDSDQQQQCFVFMLKVGGNFPLYGCCWYVREMLHRPPYLAKQQYRSCRAPFRQCMIAAPRCYCLLSHYPFFDLHFKVLKIVLDLERLERLLEYDSEKSKLRPPGPNLLAPSSPKAHSAAAAAAAPASSRRSLQDSYSTGGSAPGSLSSSRAPSPVFGTRSSRTSAAGTIQVVVSSSTGGAPPLAVDVGPTGRAAACSEGGSGQLLGPPVRRQTPDADMQPHVVHNRQLYCSECAGIIEEMCPFTPGAVEAQSLPSWSQWQQRRRTNSPLGPEGNDAFSPSLQQLDDSSRDKLHGSPFAAPLDHHGTPSVAVGFPMQCEVCRKRLRMSTPDGQPEGSSTSAATAAAVAGAPAAPAAAAGGGAAVAAAVAEPDAAASSTKALAVQPTLISALAGVLPARLSAVLQVSSSADGQNSTTAVPVAQADQQQQQQPQQQPPQQQQSSQVTAASAEASVQFDAAAVAAADFDAAGGTASTRQQPEQWAKWQDVVAAVRGPQGVSEQQQQQQSAHDGGGPGAPGQEATLAAAGSSETSMVQRMWETWAPKALEGSGSADAAAGGAAARLSGGLSLFKRSSRASGGLAEQQAPLHSSRASLPSTGPEGTDSQETQPLAADGLLQPVHAQDDLQQQAAVRRNQQQQQQQLDQATSAVQDGQPGIEQQPQQTAGHSIQQLQQQQHRQQHRQQQGGSTHSPAHSTHGPSRLRPDPAHAVPDHSEPGSAAAGAGVTDDELWSLDPNLRALSSFKGHGGGTHLAHLATGPDGLRDISTTSNVSFYSVDEAATGSSAADVSPGRTSLDGLQQQLGVEPQQQDDQQVLLQQQQQQQHPRLEQAGHSHSAGYLPEQQQEEQQQKQLLGQRGKSEVLLRRQPSPPPGQQMMPLVQLQGRRPQRWSDPASWPSRPRTPSPLPLVNSHRGSQGGRAVDSSTGADGLVSAFAAIAAAAEPFDAALPRPGTRPSTGSSLNACELGSASSIDSALPGGGAAAGGGAEVLADSADSGSQGGMSRVNVTIGGGVIPSADSKVQLSLQPPSRTASGNRRSALFEEVALRRSGDMSSELRLTISHLVQVDSGTLLAAYYASPVPQPGETYHLLLGDLYRLEFERCLPLQQYAPPGRSRLRQEVLTYAEVECAQHLQLWTVAALCRSLSVDNIVTLVNGALLEKQLVVFCPHIGTLGSVVLALVPLLRPFTWQSLVMPVTPVSMLGFLDAPVPFVLGVQYKTPDVASRCHGLMRVNVYKDAIKNASFPSLPNTRQLLAALAPHHAALCDAAPLAVERPVHIITPDEEVAAQAFLGVMHDYLSKLCGDLRLHTIVNVGMSKRTGIFMKESLLESMPAKDRPFMRAFMETQMFAAYADGVISDYCES